jgi:hypothetical protein
MNARRNLVLAASGVLAVSASALAVAGHAPIAAAVIAAPAAGPVLDLRAQFEERFPGGTLLEVQGQLRRVFGRQFSEGDTPHESVEAFLRSWSTLWGVPFDQLEPIGPFADGGHQLELMHDENGENPSFTAVYWRQHVRGVPVFRGFVWGLVSNLERFPMMLGGGTIRDLGDAFPASIEGRDLGAGTLDPAVYAGTAIADFAGAPVMTTPRYVIWAGIDADVAPAKLAVEFTADGADATDPAERAKNLYIVDAADGRVLHRESLIRHGSVSGTVTGKSTDGSKADACNAESAKALPYVQVNVGGVANYANASGAFSATYTGTGSVTVAPVLAGRYFRVSETTGSANLASAGSQSVADGGTASFIFNNTPAALQTAQVNCYLEANLIRDTVLAANPSYPTIANQLSFTINTNIGSTCNAYYDGASINFYQAGGGCNNTGFSTVVHHEFGHHVVNCGGSGQQQYGEGMSDVMSILMSDESALGVGFFSSNCTGGIRNAANSCQYSASSCSSCGSAIHSCGQLLSGCAWDLRNNLRATYPTTYRAKLRNLAVNSVPLHAGQSDIGSDIAADFLTLDDAVSNGGNGNVADGTPNYNLIAGAFNAHGLTSPSIALLLIEFPNPMPTNVDPAGGQQYELTVRPVSSQIQAGSQKMMFREGTSGAFTAIPLESLGGNSYRATFPATTCSSTLNFYFQATSTGGTVVTNPSTGPAAPFSAESQLSASDALVDDFDSTSTAFTTTGNVGASRGGWQRILMPTSNTCNGPAPLGGSTRSYVTGSLGTGCNDIDGGYSELNSPVFDAAGADSLTLQVTTYLSNDQGANPGEDPLTVQVSSDSGASWVDVDRILTSHNWTDRSWNLAQFVVPSSTMRVRFRAEDLGAGDSEVKAAVDNVRIRAVTCQAGVLGDLDGDGNVGAGDLAVMLLDFGPCSGCPSDLDSTGIVDGGDVAILLLLFTF